jgi:hypothetical protein
MVGIRPQTGTISGGQDHCFHRSKFRVQRFKVQRFRV